MDAISYRVGPDDRIISVGGGWRAFADANGAPSLVDSIVGRRLWDCMAGGTVRLVYQKLLGRARDGHIVQVPFRCDAPAIRREMRLTIYSEGDGSVTFLSEVVAAQPREPVVLPLGVPLRSCAWCARIWNNERWVEVEVALASLELLRRTDGVPELTHGICDQCEVGFQFHP